MRGWKKLPPRRPYRVHHPDPAVVEHPDLYAERLEALAEAMAEQDELWEREQRFRERDFTVRATRERRAA